MSEYETLKKAHETTKFSKKELEELFLASQDPLYFIENFTWVQHPTQGKVPLKLYPFQFDLIDTFHNNRFSIALTARQMGKSIYSNTSITQNGKKVKIKTLITHNFKEKIILFLEELLVKFRKKY